MKKILIFIICVLSYVMIADSGWLPVAPTCGSSCPNSGYDYVSSTWLNSKSCIIVGNRDNSGVLYKSNDYGKTWTLKLTKVDQLFDIASSGNNVVAVSKLGNIYYSNDSGETWTTTTPAVCTQCSFYGVTIGSNGNIVIVGSQNLVSAIYTSTLSTLPVWVLVSSNYNMLYGVTTVDGEHVTAVGMAGTVVMSTDGGVTWQSQKLATSADLYGVASTSSNSSILMAYGTAATIAISSNSGVSWTLKSLVGTKNSGIISTSIFYFRSIAILSTYDAFLVSPTNVILVTRDLGKTWIVTYNNLNYPLFSISAYNESIAVVGSSRVTTNGASTSIVLRRTPGNEFSPAPTGQPTSFPTGNNTNNNNTNNNKFPTGS